MSAPETATGGPLLEVRDLHTHYSLRGSFIDRLRGHEAGSVKAVDGVDFTLARGEVLGIVGESGSGKTTLGRTLLGLVEASEGSIVFEGFEIAGVRETRLRELRQRLQIVFQDPHASLNPAMTIGASVGDPLRFHGLATDEEEIDRRVTEVLERVGLSPAQQFMDKRPGDLSGGQKQRAALARAIILGPEVLIADEPVSMLDMSVRAKILELMLELKDELGLTYIYITHDLATAKFLCDRIAIMYLGKIVEIGPSAEIYEDPKHPYTQALLRAIPEPDPTRTVPRDLPRGEIPDAVRPPAGCPFHPRCPKAFEVCGWEGRDLRAILEEHWTRLPEPEYERERELFGDLETSRCAAGSRRRCPPRRAGPRRSPRCLTGFVPRAPMTLSGAGWPSSTPSRTAFGCDSTRARPPQPRWRRRRGSDATCTTRRRSRPQSRPAASIEALTAATPSGPPRPHKKVGRGGGGTARRRAAQRLACSASASSSSSWARSRFRSAPSTRRSARLRAPRASFSSRSAEASASLLASRALRARVTRCSARRRSAAVGPRFRFGFAAAPAAATNPPPRPTGFRSRSTRPASNSARSASSPATARRVSRTRSSIAGPSSGFPPAA